MASYKSLQKAHHERKDCEKMEEELLCIFEIFWRLSIEEVTCLFTSCWLETAVLSYLMILGMKWMLKRELEQWIEVVDNLRIFLQFFKNPPKDLSCWLLILLYNLYWCSYWSSCMAFGGGSGLIFWNQDDSTVLLGDVWYMGHWSNSTGWPETCDDETQQAGTVPSHMTNLWQ